jgi:ABC-type phosphate/phosphonate transport system permease subunit
MTKLTSLVFVLKYQHMQCQPERAETENFKKNNSVKNHWTEIKFKLVMYFLVKYLHMQFQPYTYISTKVRVWKLKISTFFQHSRGTFLSNIIKPWPKLNLHLLITMMYMYLYTYVHVLNLS